MLKTKDLFIMTKMFKKMEVKEYLEKSMELEEDKSNKKKDPMEIAKLQQKKSTEIFILFIENIDKCEEEVYQLVASFSDSTIEIVKEQDPKITIDVIKQIFSSQIFQDFFKQAVR